MARKHLCRDAVLCAALTGCLPPDNPPVKPEPPNPDLVALAHTWTIESYVLGPRALIADTDAAAFRRRTIVITATEYTSPWTGKCEDAARRKRDRDLAAIVRELDMPIESFGLVDPLVEYTLSCSTPRTPPLTLYVGGARAVTCWSGVCYSLAR